MSQNTITLGSGIGTATGTSLFDGLGAPLSALLGLTAACAFLAIALAVARYLLQPSDEATVATMQRVRRILTVATFIGLSATIITWLATGTASDPIPGISHLSALSSRGW